MQTHNAPAADLCACGCGQLQIAGREQAARQYRSARSAALQLQQIAHTAPYPAARSAAERLLWPWYRLEPGFEMFVHTADTPLLQITGFALAPTSTWLDMWHQQVADAAALAAKPPRKRGRRR